MLVKMDENQRFLIFDPFLGITESFHGRIGSDDLIFKGTATFEGWSTITTSFLSLAKSSNNSEILNDTLGVDSFTSTRFTLIDQSEGATNKSGEYSSETYQ